MSTQAVVKPFFFLYGPSGSGKSVVGRQLADSLDASFIDLDERIAQTAGCTIPEIFSREGESGFRQRERTALREVCRDETNGLQADTKRRKPSVIALGGGALLDAENRALAEACGTVICLSASFDTLLSRLQAQADGRPLLAGNLQERLQDMLSRRQAHYASFECVDTEGLTPAEVAWQLQIRLGIFHVRGMGEGYDIFVASHLLERLGEACRERGLGGPIALVSDEHVARWIAPRVIASLEGAGYPVRPVIIPAGETHKTVATVQLIWQAFADGGLERQSTVIALGGGVVNDLAGFAAATYLRGVRWVACPTSLLAMVDASLGGKTGVDLPQGKNLVGAFYPPALVLSDPDCLQTLPREELRSGMAEVVKHGVIADPQLFAQCASLPAIEQMEAVVRRAAAVKVGVIQADPYERGARAVLNLGHTIGHALEKVTVYALRHGEAVSIGMVCAASLSQALGLAQDGLEEEISSVLRSLGLPTEIPPGLNRAAILDAMRHDKKRTGGKFRFVLPVHIGKVVHGVEVAESLVQLILRAKAMTPFSGSEK